MVKDFDDIELNVIGKGVLIDLMDNQILSCSQHLASIFFEELLGWNHLRQS